MSLELDVVCGHNSGNSPDIQMWNENKSKLDPLSTVVRSVLDKGINIFGPTSFH